jgi:hypothetical protein
LPFADSGAIWTTAWYLAGHIGLISSYITWTGRRAAGETAEEAPKPWRHTQSGPRA